MLLKGAYCVGEHFVDPQCINLARLDAGRSEPLYTYTSLLCMRDQRKVGDTVYLRRLFRAFAATCI